MGAQLDFRGLVDAATDVIAVFDRDRRYVYLNAALERVTGVPGASVLGKRNDEVMLPDDALVWTEALDDVSRSGQQRAIEATLMTPRGPRRFVSVLSPVSDGLVCAVSRDITEIGRGYDAVDLEMLTELARRTGIALDNARLLAAEQEARRHAEEARDRTRRLQRLTAALSGAVDEPSVGSIMVGAGRDALGADAGVAWLLRGGDMLEVAASSYGPHPSQLERYRTIAMTAPIPVCDVARSGQPMMFENVATMAARYPEVHLTDPPLFQAWAVIPFVLAGRGAGAVAFAFTEERTFHDDDRELLAAMAGQASLALERARLYEALQNTAQQLATANRRKDEFLAMLGHELRNPLSPIATALDVMEIRDPDAMHEERAVIRRQVDHLSRLIGDLLDVSRITRGKIQLTREVVELDAVLAVAIEMVAPMLERRMQPLAVDVARDGLRVDADPTRLAQVFHNLLINAAKYSEPRSQITVRALGCPDHIVVQVVDQGIGIPADLLPRLFDLFVQGERTLDRSQGGLGIGLTIARSLCELHGGTIAVVSAGPGRGSTFSVTLPRAARAEPRSPAPAARLAAPSLGGRRVLVVDDNVDAAQMLHELLAQLGHETAVAHDGAAALVVAGAFQPDVAVLDIGLPAMDGYELARRLRAQRGASALRLIAVTGYGQDTDRMRAQAAGFDHHLIKPIAAEALVALLAADLPAARERLTSRRSEVPLSPLGQIVPGAARAAATVRAMQRFLDTDLDRLLAERAGGDPMPAMLDLFRRTAAGVPAYAAFLRERGIDPASVRGADDWRRLPRMTKPDYFRRHPLPALCRGGELAACDMLAVSSGSTGEPTLWPRALGDELAVALRFEQVFRDSFCADQRTTLAVVCFPLGTWVGGMFTAACCRHLAAKGYPVTVVTPGNHRAEILRAVAALGRQFDQTVLLGYPPFLKDVVDAGIAEGFAWRDQPIRLVLAGEVISEEWRDLMAERLGLADPARDTASLYGTADAGVLGNETPLSIAIRRFCARDPAAARAVFGQARLPTLVQVDPFERFFEEHDGTLVFSADGGIPLVRYHIADEGGIWPHAALIARLAELGFDAEAEARRGGDRGIRPLPFVHVFGRSHFAVSYYGANVFPDTVIIGLEQPAIRERVTGKFVMEIREDDDRNRALWIAVELSAAGAHAPPGPLGDAIAESILASLVRLNSEFANYVPAARQRPQITLWPAGHPEYFPVGVKHRYSRPPASR